MILLAPWDLESATTTALDKAAELALALQAELVLLHVAAPEPDFVGYEVGPDEVRQQIAEELRGDHRRMQTKARKLRERGIRLRALMMQGTTTEVILREAERLPADMIVMTPHRRGFMAELILGSVSRSVLREAQTPVLMVPPGSGDLA